MARSRISWGPAARDFWEGGGRIKEETESESGIMKHFIIDLITVKSPGNHRGANKGNPFNITRGKTGAIKMLKSSRDDDGFVREKIGSIYLFTYLLVLLASCSERMPTGDWNFLSPIRAFKTSLNTGRFHMTCVSYRGLQSPLPPTLLRGTVGPSL